MLIMKLREYWNARESDKRGNAEDEGVRRKERGWPGEVRTEKGYERGTRERVTTMETATPEDCNGVNMRREEY